VKQPVAQSLVAVQTSSRVLLSETDPKQVREHLDYIERVLLPNEEGWGYMNAYDWGVTEIAGWVVLAYLASTQPNVIDLVWGGDSEIAFQRITRDLRLLLRRQLTNGAWAPINQSDNPGYARTYSTTMALWALIEAKKHPEIGKRTGTAYNEAIKGGIRWLLARYDNQREGWVPNPERTKQTDSFPGLTAQVLYVLGRARPEFGFLVQEDPTYNRARQALIKSIGSTLASRPANSNDRTHDSDRYLPHSKFMVESSTFLWFPWSIAFCSQLSVQSEAEMAERKAATRGCTMLLGRINELIKFARDDPFAYVMAESLFAINQQLAVRPNSGSLARASPRHRATERRAAAFRTGE
jgi:hypothetical protein